MKRKHHKIDINELNNKIVKRKMENPLYIPNELDLRFLNLPYMAKQMRGKMKGEKIPRNIEETIAGLDSLLSMEDKEYLKENGSIAVHHTLGMYIRNEWGLWAGSELKSELEKRGLSHPDDMSDYVISEYINVLKRREADETGQG